MTSPLAFRLMGHGIAYSASPAMMRAAFAAMDLPHGYELADVPPEDVETTVQALREPAIGGANVTTPHKVAVVRLMDALGPEAEEAGAVNTVVRQGRRLVGHNTDLPALVDAIRGLRPDGVRKAVLLGAGGASRSVIIALQACGAGEIVPVMRSDGSWDRLGHLMDGADLVVNATPVGMSDERSPLPASWLRPDLAVLDLVYRPSPTPLVHEARAIGASAQAGAGVLLGQGWRSLELWLHEGAPIDAMRSALKTELGDGADV
jgi:shikimate dehydrogenase